MKKSRLRKIIRESIKGVLTEQQHNTHGQIEIEICGCVDVTPGYCDAHFHVGMIHTLGSTGPGATGGIDCNGQMCTSQDIGNIFEQVPGQWGASHMYLTFKLIGLN